MLCTFCGLPGHVRRQCAMKRDLVEENTLQRRFLKKRPRRFVWFDDEWGSAWSGCCCARKEWRPVHLVI